MMIPYENIDYHSPMATAFADVFFLLLLIYNFNY